MGCQMAGTKSFSKALFFLFFASSGPSPAVINGVDVTATVPTEKLVRETISPVVKLGLKRKDGGTGTCTGTVIDKAPPLILTAEHCVNESDVSEITYKDSDLKD